MFLENLVVDAVEPQQLGRFWEAVVGGERLTDEPEGFETRLAVDRGPVLDLCFQRVADPTPGPPRLHVDLAGGARTSEVVERVLGLGARRPDGRAGDVHGVVLADPEGNPFCVTDREGDAPTGPVAACRLASADPSRDAGFWSWLTGWVGVAGAAERSLRHPSGRGPLLVLDAEAGPKTGKNRFHLDVRLEDGEDADTVEAAIVERGGHRVEPGWGELPWRTYTDPSGNEFCVLPHRP